MSQKQQPKNKFTFPQPAGIKVSRDEVNHTLTITQHWLNSGHVMMGAMGLFMLIFFTCVFFSPSNFSDRGGLTCLIVVPLCLIGYGSIGLINSTTIELTPATLTIRHGPIPWGKAKEFSRKAISQLYIKRKVHKSKNKATYSYDLYAITAAQHQKLLSGIVSPEQADYLERIIEHFLHLQDKPVPDEWELKAIVRTWLSMAYALDLESYIEPNKLRTGGAYRGYRLDLSTNNLYEAPTTRLTVRPLPSQPIAENEVSLKQIKRLFNLEPSIFVLTGQLHSEQPGQGLTYHQNGRASEDDLKRLIDKCCDLLDAYPGIIALGGEVVSLLNDIQGQQPHFLRHVAQQWLREIADQTTQRFSQKMTQFRCADCLTALGPHGVKLGLLDKITYYGCRLCGQSQRLLETPHGVETLLDRSLTKAHQTVEGVTQINWLERQDLFDFDAVRIVEASDEEVERFAVQVGNDTDSLRQPRYQAMRCIVSADSHLSENTLRILERTFGQVQVEASKPLSQQQQERTVENETRRGDTDEPEQGPIEEALR